MTKKLENKTALITGGSRGLGLSVAKAYAREGAHVILVSRTRGALEEADDAIREVIASVGGSGGATLVPLNLTRFDKLDALGPSLFDKFPHIDILVGNAGQLGPLSPLDHIRNDDWQNILDINLTANWRLIRTIGPLLKRAEAGRAIFVTAGAAAGNKAYWGPYAASKAGLEALVKTYAAECANTDIRVNLIDPGPLATNLRAKAYPGEDPATLPSTDDPADLFIKLASTEMIENGQLFKFEK